MRALQIAASGMSAQQMRVDVISNNLANMSTTGYNPRRAEFADLQYQQATRPGTLTAATGAMVPAGVQLGLGVRPASVTVMLAQGTPVQTNGDLDIAIDGNGYLEVTMPSGISAYTRDGSLKRSAEGQVVTSEGYPLVPDITIPEDARSIAINADGQVFAYFDDRVEPENLGQITLANFVNAKGLEAIGSNLFLETAASGAPQVATPGQEGLGTIRAGFLEESAVDPVREIAELIKAQRGYELNSKVITAADQMLGTTVQVR
ncbi:flagellar basal-body rod protein FlgG [Paracoccus sp. P2]|uniref:Flagellar basal-body rod protein FlgG n=1 Tax=Paracoccus pantotrophus TaxID=82367 RepID=A0A7H9BVK3_PARPN|nr:flagellar basal-body rod protein FlgG [Paracoccus pantotrophus]MDF3856310.1 flagellar basal-body rod protein FlgG [Paracoccus pantotrophus]QLH15430.1 flagellar basal-body rod protein FlgG [Paracoccus pantotrophus]RDD94259.1 flagellar basal-body rod protein FlgG [Paracoccus pantotrophus]RNI20380.1 flagellar basal-body rod protein FlgG [Paracoccus pantotrophus]WGR65573.1 flagellar basal-body rod protein FlgG [Paracoccus pantotrophus]